MYFSLWFVNIEFKFKWLQLIVNVWIEMFVFGYLVLCPFIYCVSLLFCILSQLQITLQSIHQTQKAILVQTIIPMQRKNFESVRKWIGCFGRITTVYLATPAIFVIKIENGRKMEFLKTFKGLDKACNIPDSNSCQQIASL